jgi:allene oxide cyclase
MRTYFTKRMFALATAAIVAVGATLVASPSASAQKADLVWYLDRTFREVIDIGKEGDSVGDLTVTNGNISETRNGKAVGSYVTSQITVSVLIPGGRQDRKTDLALTVGNNTIYATSLVAANAGTPPTRRTLMAITGGTGKYSGARGQIVLRPLSDTQYKVSFFFVN